MRAIWIGLVAVIVLSLGIVARVAAFETPPVKVVVDGRMTVKGVGGEGLLPVAVSQDWSRPLPNVTRAVIVVHGAHRNADSIFRATAQLAPDDGALIVAPQFLAEKDVVAHSLANDVLRWDRDDWSTGADAIGPAAISSYEAVDALLLVLVDRSRFPNLKAIVIAGFSGGGWLSQRYAALGRAPTDRGIATRYIVGSPSSYLYFSADRPGPDGVSGAFTEAATCSNFNRWPYGLAGTMPRYVEAAARGGAATMERRYAGLDLVYLVGTADNDPNHWELDKSCAAEAEGPNRYARAVNFFHYMQARDAAMLRQRLWTAPGAGHDEKAVFGSPCGRAALFDQSGCSGG